MGVEARIVLFEASEDQAVAAAEAAFARIEALEQSYSDWRPTSELSLLFARAGEGPIGVSPDLLAVLSQAREVAARSEGAFDPTAGPLVDLWREARRARELPDPAALARARELVGWRLLEVHPGAGTAALARRGMRLDLGGIGKGWACQEAVDVLSALGVRSALVQMGGDLVVSEPPPGAEGWSVDTRAGPAEAGVEGVRERVLVAREAVSTSGDDVQFVEIGGRRYSHVVDPRTGMALTTHVRAVVVAPTGGLADALSTAAGVLGPDAALELVGLYEGCDAFVERRGEGGVVRASARFR